MISPMMRRGYHAAERGATGDSKGVDSELEEICPDINAEQIFKHLGSLLYLSFSVFSRPVRFNFSNTSSIS